MNALTLGLLSGLGLAVSAGPVFLTIIQVSMSRGFNNALIFIVGVALADWTMIAVAMTGLNLIDLDFDPEYFYLIGGIAVALFGATFLIDKKGNKEQIDQGNGEAENERQNAPCKLLLKGILMNSLNPVIWTFWAGVSQFSMTTFPMRNDQLLYFVALLITVSSFDVIKAFFAEKLKPFFKSKFLNYLDKGIGVLLIGIGIKLLYDFFS